MKTVIVVQARMGSSRLPGKVLKPVLGRALLDYQWERLRRVKGVAECVLATTVEPADDILAEFCRASAIPCFRGSETDVLSRYFHAAEAAHADAVVRITSDCPLIDPAVIDQVIAAFGAGGYDYVSNVLDRTFPRGMDTEIFSFRALREAHEEATLAGDREHVTPFFYRQPERYRLHGVKAPEDLSRFRFTVDTAEDLDLVTRLIEHCYPRNPEFTLSDLVEAMRLHPSWIGINRHVEQKKA